MNSYLQSSALIESVQRRAALPIAQVTFSANDFLEFANEELQNSILPLLLSMHEEYLVYTLAIPMGDKQYSYTIPNRAIGCKLRSLFWQDTMGKLHPMIRIQPDNRADIQTPYTYYVKNNSFIISPYTPIGSLVVDFFLRPNQLVTDDRVGVIFDFQRDFGKIVLSNLPTGFNVGLMDLLETAGGHRIRALDIVPLSLQPDTVNNITTLFFNPTDLPLDLALGDHLAMSGECMIPQIPDELHSLLAQRVACRCLEALGDKDGLAAANGKLKEIESRIGALVNNRIEGAPKKIVNPRNLLRSNRFRVY